MAVGEMLVQKGFNPAVDGALIGFQMLLSFVKVVRQPDGKLQQFRTLCIGVRRQSAGLQFHVHVPQRFGLPIRSSGLFAVFAESPGKFQIHCAFHV